MEILEHAYAKLNLSLDVVRKMEDGYHDMCMVMQSIDLCDDVLIRCEPGPGKVQACTNLHFLPNDEKNIAVKAAEVFFKSTGINQYDTYIQLKKRIPVCAGMGGGSADGAAVLRGLNSMFSAGLDGQTLRKLAESVGSDVPFCIEGGTCLAKGRGEILTQLKALPECSIVVCKPAVSISTPQLFSRIKCSKIKFRPDTKGLIQALEDGSLDAVSKRMFNVFEAVIPNNAGEIFEIKETLLDYRALGAVMTGTGSAVFGVFDCSEHARNAYEFLSERYADCYLARPVSKLDV